MITEIRNKWAIKQNVRSGVKNRGRCRAGGRVAMSIVTLFRGRGV